MEARSLRTFSKKSKVEAFFKMETKCAGTRLSISGVGFWRFPEHAGELAKLAPMLQQAPISSLSSLLGR
jgi:hypothetical protein